MNNEQVDLFSSFDDLTIHVEEFNDTVEHKKEYPFDEFIRRGGNSPLCKAYVIDAFMKGISIENIARLMSKTYKGFNGFNNISGKYTEEGITITGNRKITWIDAAKRAEEMLEEGIFCTIAELDYAKRCYIDSTAQDVWYTFRDIDKDKFTEEWSKRLCHGFPEDQCLLKIEFAERFDELMETMTDFVEAYNNDKTIMRFKFHNPVDLMRRLKYMKRPYVRTFTTSINDFDKIKEFITQDEIYSCIIGSGSNVEGCKGRIQKFFNEESDKKKRCDFLKDEYGIGGRSHALSGANHSYEDHNSKGITLKKDNCETINLSWSDVLKYYETAFMKGDM